MWRGYPDLLPCSLHAPDPAPNDMSQIPYNYYVSITLHWDYNAKTRLRRFSHFSILNLLCDLALQAVNRLSIVCWEWTEALQLCGGGLKMGHKKLHLNKL